MRSSNPPPQIPLPLPARELYTREDYMIWDGNRDAAGWIGRWPDWPGPAIILSAPKAGGKTHLAQIWKTRAQAESIPPLQASMFTANRPLLVDDAHLWIGQRSAEETLFHLYNQIKEQGTTLLLTMEGTPQEREFQLPDLASRLRAAPVITIEPPDEDVLAAMLVKLFSDRQLRVPAEVIHYILPRIERTYEAVRTLVESADRAALSQQRAITIPLIGRLLHET